MTLFLVFAVLSVILISVKIFYKNQKPSTGLFLKTTLSSLFLILGVIGFLSSGGGPMACLFLIGLASCLAGDILLEINGQITFVVGVAFFGAGHLLFVAGYLIGIIGTYGGEGLKDRGPLLFAAIILVLMAGFAVFKLKIPKGLFFMTAAYLTVLSLMCAMAFLYAWVSGNRIFAVIAGLFALSDSSLTVGLYGEKKNTVTEVCCLYPYYLSQLLLAFVITAL